MASSLPSLKTGRRTGRCDPALLRRTHETPRAERGASRRRSDRGRRRGTEPPTCGASRQREGGLRSRRSHCDPRESSPTCTLTKIMSALTSAGPPPSAVKLCPPGIELQAETIRRSRFWPCCCPVSRRPAARPVPPPWTFHALLQAPGCPSRLPAALSPSSAHPHPPRTVAPVAKRSTAETRLWPTCTTMEFIRRIRSSP